MRWWLAALGFVIGRWWGALAGFLIGSWLDGVRRLRAPRVPPPGATPPVEVLEDLVTLAVAVARADGRLEAQEIRTIREFFETRLGFRGSSLNWLRNALKTESEHPGDFATAADRLGRRLGPAERLLILHVLSQVALADGRVDPAEQRLLLELAGMWGIPMGMPGGFGGSTGGARSRPAPRPDARLAALQELGLPPDADRGAIDKRWKELAREHHPDRFAHLGEELTKAAHERFIRIQDAYRTLTKAA